jgi:hypothetical protein
MGSNRWPRLSEPFGAVVVIGVLSSTGCALPVESDAEEIASQDQPITGGSLVASNVAPFSSAVKWKSAVGSCSATKIGARRFLTAAHCFNFHPAPPFTVQLTNDLFGTFGSTFNVTAVAAHPSYEGFGTEAYSYDIAVFDIAESTPSIPTLSTIFPEYISSGRQLLAVAYGCDTRSGNDGMKQQATVAAHTLAEFQLHVNHAPEVVFDLYTHDIVTGNPPAWCSGDSGGPLLVQNGSGAWQIAGVISGIDNGGEVSYTARTGNVRSWIAAPGVNVFTNGSGGFLLNARSNKCIGIDGMSTVNGAAAVQSYCDGRLQNADHQFWRLQSNGTNHFMIVNGRSGRCLGVSGASTANGAPVGQFTCNGSLGAADNQSWRFTQNVPGHFFIVNGKSGRCLGVNGNSTASGAALAQFTCNGAAGGNDNQSWRLSR